MSLPFPNPLDHYRELYSTGRDVYEQLISCEDAAGALLPALEAAADFDSAKVLECGAGTGRLTRLIAPRVAALKAFDAAPEMLDIARQKLAGFPKVELAQADHGSLPVENNWADIAIEGWAFGHAVGWHPSDWEALTDQYVNELFRILRPKGTAILIETLGTGKTSPEPPNEALARLYARWEAFGFERRVIRTDYRFATLETAKGLTQAFFRTDFTFDIRDGGVFLPECTGLWRKQKP
jgi:ubiquinone/menaquinone biosynthesis C-methylase UbiE